MSLTLQSLGLDRLTREERISLVQTLWESIVKEDQPWPLSESQIQELERRADEDDATPEDLIPWDDVKAKARTRFRT